MTPTKSLTIHPSAADLPMPPDDDPSTKAVISSICEMGVLQPLKVCKGRVVDGRLRLRGAIAAGLAEVPTVEIDEQDVASVILHLLLARRHYTKSALAYLAVPILEAALTETRKRAVQAAKIGASASSSKCTPCTFANTVEEIAERMGISQRYLLEAKAVRKKFSSYPQLREQWKPKILSGEMGLGQVQQAISGKIAALHGNTTPKGDAQQLLFELFDTAKVRFGRWEQLGDHQRKAAIAKFGGEFLPSLPPDLLDEAARFLATRAKAA